MASFKDNFLVYVFFYFIDWREHRRTLVFLRCTISRSLSDNNHRTTFIQNVVKTIKIIFRSCWNGIFSLYTNDLEICCFFIWCFVFYRMDMQSWDSNFGFFVFFLRFYLFFPRQLVFVLLRTWLRNFNGIFEENV